MAVSKEFNIKTEVDTTDVDKLVTKLDELIESQKTSQDEAEKLNEETKKTSESTKGLGKAAKAGGKGFKALGGAMKAAGIGLVVGLVVKLTEAFSKNQKAMDAVNTVFTTISGVLSQVVTVITNAVTKVSEATNGFEGMKKVIGGLLTLAITPLKLAFFSISLAVQEAQLAWEQSFFGDGDPKKIQSLKEGIEGTKQSIVDTGKNAIQAGKDVAENAGKAVSEVAAVVEETSENLDKVNVEATKESAKRITQLRNEAKLAEAELQGVTLQAQKEAEEQRQIRDDVSRSIDERIAANERLGEILEEQAEKELSLAEKRVAVAREELKMNPENVDAKAKLQEALNGVAEVEERINSQKSEQLTNEQALRDERRANLQELRKIGKTETELAKEEALQRYENRKQLIDRTVKDEKEKNRLLKEAENAYTNNLKKINKEREEDKRKSLEKVLELEKKFTNRNKNQFEIERQAVKEKYDAAIKAAEKAGRDTTKLEKARAAEVKDINIKETEAKIKLEEQKRQATISVAQSTLGALSGFAEEGSKLAKGIAIAQATISTAESALNAYKSVVGVPVVGPVLAPIAAAAAVASGIAQIRSIQQTDPMGKGSSGSPSAASSSTPAASQAANAATSPNFNVVQGAQQNQLLGDVSQGVNQPTRAYVVGKDVSTQQEADRNRVSNAKLAG